MIWVSEILTSGDSETTGASSGSSLSAHENISVLSAYVPQHLFVCVYMSVFICIGSLPNNTPEP